MPRNPPDSSQIACLPPDEVVNALTHGLGLILSVTGSIVLIACALSQGDAWNVAGCSVFAATLIAVYASSTLSHSTANPRLRHLFRILDQGFIYLLIAGTYTPFALAYLRFGWWWLLFGAMWTVALGGCLSKLLFSHRVNSVAVWIYVLLGWMPIVGIGAILEIVPAVVLWWILIGGLCYTFGTIFLICDYRRFHFHAIWHLFVMAGSSCHFFAILFFVVFSTAERL